MESNEMGMGHSTGFLSGSLHIWRSSSSVFSAKCDSIFFEGVADAVIVERETGRGERGRSSSNEKGAEEMRNQMR
jgi:hypothetical protein